MLLHISRVLFCKWILVNFSETNRMESFLWFRLILPWKMAVTVVYKCVCVRVCVCVHVRVC